MEQAIKEIEDSSSHQAQVIVQINQGLTQVAAVVQTNAATAEESSSSSEELAAQAQTLQEEVSRFRLKEEESQRAYRQPVPAYCVTYHEIRI